MIKNILRPKHGPEWHMQKKHIVFLETRGWLVEVMHGNAFQRGIPDLYLFNRDWGERWVDVKHAEKYTFTKAQRHKWPRWESKGIGIWILTAATQEEYDKLFRSPNWRHYWKDSWAVPTEADIDILLAELDEEFDEEEE